MKEKLYLTDSEVIMNFDLSYPETKSNLIKSAEFQAVVRQFLRKLQKKDEKLCAWACPDGNEDAAVENISKTARELLVFDIDEADSSLVRNRETALEFVERLYDYWRTLERYSVTTNRRGDAESTAFVSNDSAFNHLIINTFRRIEQTLMGRPNKVFRQQNAGTNASLACYRRDSFRLSDRYAVLKNVLFIDSVMMRTPMILHPKSNKREWPFEEVSVNPITTFEGNPDIYFCFPAKVGTLTIFIYFHRDFMSNGVSCANLFEIATQEEASRKPDCILIFGNRDNKDKCTFYHDTEEDLWVGSVSYSDKISYFGYMKKTVLTLHNVAMMQRGRLPIHGAFVNITLENDKKKGICLMGDSGAGKSETIEALKNLGSDKIKNIEIVFDDMGSFQIRDGRVYAQGTETGAFVRLDDLDPGTPYRDMNRSIFFNPDQSNARVITPAAPYSVITDLHPVDLFVYANNYDDMTGMRRIEDIEEAKEIFIRGRRMAKGTTQETGFSETYFANPFGPMQQQEICRGIIDDVFRCLADTGVFVGEVYTRLGRDPEDRAGIQTSAQDLLDFIENN
ncbi:hypothetical protein [Hornefia butyriciproducens]|uniref:hypothetical protein n=1 Tax=Hornefia butyriciproducens TaxID=2652293 RepID=UPI003F89D376